MDFQLSYSLRREMLFSQKYSFSMLHSALEFSQIRINRLG